MRLKVASYPCFKRLFVFVFFSNFQCSKSIFRNPLPISDSWMALFHYHQSNVSYYCITNSLQMQTYYPRQTSHAFCNFNSNLLNSPKRVKINLWTLFVTLLNWIKLSIYTNVYTLNFRYSRSDYGRSFEFSHRWCV